MGQNGCIVYCMNGDTLTINVPVVYMARDVLILMRENPLHGPLEGPRGGL